MHLLRHLGDGRLEFKLFPGDYKPPYAILSHTWGNVEDEVTFQDIENETAKDKSGYNKITFCINRMIKDNLEYVWIDTCCINKTNGSELSEAIVSMFRWYEEATKCYVFLSDVFSRGIDCNQGKEWMRAFESCRWFTRGWTLQELIAPRHVMFFSNEEDLLGEKHELVRELSNITGIRAGILDGTMELSELSYAERVSWMQSRNTQKKEDLAYSLLGVLGVHMPPCYGEGKDSAMRRLHKEFSSTHGPLSHIQATATKRSGSSKAAGNTRLPDRCRQMRPYCRSYEPLVLLYTLGTTTRDDYVPVALPSIERTMYSPLKTARRSFLEDMAYLCDHDVGNGTVVAIGLQKDKPRNVLWIASNTSPRRRILNFVEERLLDIQQMSTSLDGCQPGTMKLFVSACIEFAAARAREDISCLIVAFRECKIYSEDNCPEEVPGLLEWINECAYQTTLASFCHFAYKCQRSRYMDTLAKLSLQFRERIGSDASQNPFDRLRRHLTHLGRRFQAARALLTTGPRLADLSGNIDVRPVPTPVGCTLPPADVLTNFTSIIGRMHSDQSRLDKYKRILEANDTDRVLFRQFLQNYRSGNIRPIIHAEIQILDMFHTQQYCFVEDDRFIACSRPACWSCSAYFTSHPGRFELSCSDQNICLSWRPPPLEDLYDADIEKDRRDTLDDFNNRSRREVMHRILNCFPVSSNHLTSPKVASDAKLLEHDRKPIMDYTELIAPLRELCGPQKMTIDRQKVEPRNTVSVPLEKALTFHSKSQCFLRSDSGILENPDDSDSEGGVKLPLCILTQQVR